MRMEYFSRNNLLGQFAGRGGKIEWLLCVQGEGNAKRDCAQKAEGKTSAWSLNSSLWHAACASVGFRRAARIEIALLHDQQQEQLPVADLRTSNDKRTALAQLRLGFEEAFFSPGKLQIEQDNPHRSRLWNRHGAQNICSTPSNLHCLFPVVLLRLADDSELIVAKQFLECFLDSRSAPAESARAARHCSR